MTDQGVKSEKRLYRTRVFARVHPTPLLQVLAGKGRREGEGGKKSRPLLPLALPKADSQDSEAPCAKTSPGSHCAGHEGTAKAARTPAPSDGRGEASTVSLPGLVLGLLMSHAAGGSAALAFVPAQSCIGTEWAHICELPSLSVQVTMLNSLEKHRELFLVLLSTVHIICLLTGPCLFFLVAFQAGDHFNKLRHNRI